MFEHLWDRDRAIELPRTEAYIIAVSRTGEILWRIVRPLLSRQGEDWEESFNPYTGLGYKQDGSVIQVGDWHGCDYELDPVTGEVSNPVFSHF